MKETPAAKRRVSRKLPITKSPKLPFVKEARVAKDKAAPKREKREKPKPVLKAAPKPRKPSKSAKGATKPRVKTEAKVRNISPSKTRIKKAPKTRISMAEKAHRISEKKPRSIIVEKPIVDESARARKKSTLDSEQRAALAAHFADEKKATEITLLDVRGLCNFADIFIICTASNRVQLNAIAENIALGLKKAGERTPLQDGHRNANWSVLDFGDVVIHVMSNEARAFYRLEKLWGDAKDINWADVLATMPKPPSLGQ